ncbi:hypothetical protein FACS1894211_09730 [Clostridia bacterium]|nr:hypothetical protein FACS1894211_09730 [Clostridia bacterium]
MELSDALSKRLNALLKEKHLTQYRLGKSMGIPQSTISQIRNAHIPSPKISTIAPIAWGLGVTLSEFFNDPLFDEGNLNL